VPGDASDNLIVEAYQNQMLNATDARNYPFYLEFLQAISLERNSEVIQEACALEFSKGRYDMQSLRKAFRSMGLEFENDNSYDDNYILGMFHSRLEDMAMHERDLRNDLRIIGDFRGSRTICDTAENGEHIMESSYISLTLLPAMNTYEQALLFLGADDTVSDDQITALFGAKVGDNKTLEAQAMQAVRLIADRRKSMILQGWIDAGFSGDLQMSAVEGFQALQIDNRTVEDELIVTQYDFIVGENPANAEYYTKALDAIARDRSSPYLRGHLERAAPQPSQGTNDEPVGLDNIGNTCYLNSLLQFLFTMVELRQVVLHFDQYKMEVSESTMLQKKVGQRKVTNREVQTAQKCKYCAASSGLC
jgi:ubiquitin carboxyl-terminal hydrolase 25